ncbi:MAG: hypothetical protein AAF802_27165, partial [Planctomycetota bacterium]
MYHRAASHAFFISLVSLLAVGRGKCVAQEVTGLEIRSSLDGISASDPGKLTFVLISNQPANAFLDVAEPLWCESELQRSFGNLFESRPDFRSKCVGVSMRCGVPPRLAGGERIVAPGRLILMVIDHSKRILGIQVGIPTESELSDLVEDSLEIKASISTGNGNAGETSAMAMLRSEERMERQYREFMDRLQSELPDRMPFNLTEPLQQREFASMLMDLEELYAFDVKLRFGLNLRVDHTRLLLLEQHIEARLDWCQFLLPWVVGQSVEEVAKPLIESVWDAPAVFFSKTDETERLSEWVASLRDHSLVAIDLEPTGRRKSLPWPPQT